MNKKTEHFLDGQRANNTEIMPDEITASLKVRPVTETLGSVVCMDNFDGPQDETVGSCGIHRGRCTGTIA